jgi:anti-sigma regulatory factor (Ser/Thr protein kinase)
MEPMPTPAHAPVCRAVDTCPEDVAFGRGIGVPRGNAARNPSGDQDKAAVLTMPGRPEQVPVARAFASQLLGHQHAHADTVVLLISELVTNSVRHSRSARAGGWVTIAVTCTQTAVLVEVTDEGSDTMPSIHPANGRDEHGYGLALVDALAVRWGCIRIGSASTTCWFEVGAATLCAHDCAAVEGSRYGRAKRPEEEHGLNDPPPLRGRMSRPTMAGDHRSGLSQHHWLAAKLPG